jgi:hydrogenase expression/formation protein HypC
MCLAVPGKVIDCGGDEATVDLQGNRLRINRVLTPAAEVGDWVLVHAGFAITTLEEKDALETWSYLRGAYGNELDAIVADEEPPS